MDSITQISCRSLVCSQKTGRKGLGAVRSSPCSRNYKISTNTQIKPMYVCMHAYVHTYIHTHIHTHMHEWMIGSQSQWPRGLRRRYAAVRLLRLWVRIPPGAWTSVCCECCVLPDRGFCDELITRPEESYRVWYVVVCDLETSSMSRPWLVGGCRDKKRSMCGKTQPYLVT